MEIQNRQLQTKARTLKRRDYGDIHEGDYSKLTCWVNEEFYVDLGCYVMLEEQRVYLKMFVWMMTSFGRLRNEAALFNSSIYGSQ